jgi:RNA polymerase sigma-70 factor, ECF subfamily
VAAADKPEDDARLVARVAEGDTVAYEALVDIHAARLTFFAARLLKDQAEAEDVVQETFVRLWQRANEYDERFRVTTWLHRIAHHLAVDRLRKRGRNDALDEDDELPAPDSSPPSLYAHKERAEAVRAALGALPERQAAALTLVHIQGFTGGEAAEVLGVGPEALESLLSRGKRRLRELLATIAENNS